MAEYKSRNSGLLKMGDVKNGDKLLITEPAYETFNEEKQKSYWNCKVKLPDGTVKLAGLMDSVCDQFAGKWGSNTDEWAGHTAIVAIKTSKAGNEYISMWPSDEPKAELPKAETTITRGVPLAEGVEYPTEDINPADIPF